MIKPLTVPKQRLDHYLAERYPEVSRAFLQKLCNTNQVLVNDVPQKSGYRLQSSDNVTVLYDMAAIEKIEDIDLPILYQDDSVLVINKPAGVISHSRGKYWKEPSVASFIRQPSMSTSSFLGSGDRMGIVHRLDRATSGVMICAKNPEAMVFLQKQFADRKVKKTYVAIVRGHLVPPKAIIDMPIERNPKAPATFRVGPNGKTAQTAYTILKSSDLYDEVQLEPLTGRTHQLRVHLAHQHHPIIGDVLYEGESAERLLLHAHKLAITLPNGKQQTFTAPLPSIFANYMNKNL